VIDMKVCLFVPKNSKLVKKSGIGRAIRHQKMALDLQGINHSAHLTEDCDIVHLNMVFKSSRKMVKKAHKAGKKVVYHAHTTAEDIENSFMFSNFYAKRFKKTLRKTYQSADYIITPTNYSRNILLNYGITKEIAAISNGIELKSYSQNKDKEQKFLEKFKINENDKIVMGVGLFFKRKGLLDFIAISKQMPDVKFFWFGHTPLLTLPKDIRKAIKGRPANCIFPGYVEGDIIQGAYSRSDCFFFPSFVENEGIVVLEALASRQKIIIRDVDTYTDWLTHGKNCLKGNNNEEFIEYISACINGEYEELRDEAYKVAEERSIEIVSEKIKAVYEKVLGSND